LNLRQRAARDPRLAGGKGAGLAHLHALGLAVPQGFVITTAAFAHVAGRLGRATSAGSATPGPDGLPAELERRILACARKLGGPYAVRSSLMGEDATHASMAGQLATFLDVPDENVLLDAVKRCYASAFAPRLAVYRRQIGQTEELPADGKAGQTVVYPAMAVVVQRMQPSRVAGVAFSADPVSGRRCVIIEAAAGRPDAVVRGRVNPARWRVDARGVLIESSSTGSDEQLLSPERILELARFVRRIAGRLVDPVDVEWLWDGERFWFLQARPISTLAGRHVYSCRLVADMSPGLIKPLLWSTNTLGMTRKVFGRIFDEVLGPTDLDYGQLARCIHSRLYTDMTLLGTLLVRLGLPANFFEILARDEVGERPRLRPSFGQLLRMRRVLPFLWRHLRANDAIRGHIASQDAALNRYREADWQGQSGPELLAQAEDLQVLHGRSQWFIFLAAFNSLLRKRILDRMVRRHAPGVDPADLIRGLTGLKALEPNRRLRELATLARALPSDQLLCLRTGAVQDIESSLRVSEPGRRLLEGFAAFMREFGFLSACGTDISGESWAERPELVWQVIAQNSQPDRLAPASETAVIRRETRDRVRRLLHPLQRGVFARLMRSTIVYLHLRERVSLLHTEGAYQMRRVFLAIGRKLVEADALGSTQDVFYLYIEELGQLVTGNLVAAQAREMVERRRAALEADARIIPDETVCGDTPPVRLTNVDQPRDHLVGIGGSSGLVEGHARIVQDPLAAPADLGPRDILVVPFTDVGWTPLFARIGGIVAETGGQLSHTAIVAREYNLPAVVSVPHATRLLREKQPITLDGLSGRVYMGHVLEGKEMPA
jgi:pyruvate,water dikinase